MILEMKQIKNIEKLYGDTFYVLDIDKFIKNYNDLLTAFRAIYANTFIAYSYKTNYIPRLCKIVNELGGYAEVVSDMEYSLARKVGVSYSKIAYNGPYKNKEVVKELLLNEGIVNLDCLSEWNYIKEIAHHYPKKVFKLGLRCNYTVTDDSVSRFGIDINGGEFQKILEEVESIKNIIISGLHCHFAPRSLEVWKNKISGVISLMERVNFKDLEYISVGGGLFGNMPNELKSQFNSEIPNFSEYAKCIAFPIKEFFCKADNENVKLFLEPGTALVGDVMEFVCRVISTKRIGEHNIAMVTGSIYNINPTLNTKNPPIRVLSADNIENDFLEKCDFGGYTCIESDYLYKNYSGKVGIGDYVVFGNVGSYSIVLKPPFILPNVPVVEINKEQIVSEIKRSEKLDDIFQTYRFE